MSRSYRKPYATVCGVVSAHEDKKQASRGVRRKQDQYLKNHWDDEDFILPHRLECKHNDPWGWNRDGNNSLRIPTARDWSTYCYAVNGYGYYNVWPSKWRKADSVWPPKCYTKYTRK